ncbi:MAG: hypothetical protein CMM15_06555 [Rhodospirillaceae bacterium]|nr:hypothetical protein [Rhodospirillaceae bacterium]|tara:strand:+ start:1959 stop:2846 length:888 start_codon:yes stop_codon:yes gene_type:complete
MSRSKTDLKPKIYIKEKMADIEFELRKLNELIEEQEPCLKTTEDDMTSGCQHENLETQGSSKICMDCGTILMKDFSYEKEWRYYGVHDTKHANDPNRCNFRKHVCRNIDKDVEKLGINAKIRNTANDIYKEVTQNKIYRGNTRKGIIFACVYHAYKINSLPHSCEQLITIFEINQKTALKGLKFVNLNLPIHSNIRNETIDIPHLIKETMQNFSATPVQVGQVLELYRQLENRSSLLNRSRPQSVACGVVKYFILQKNPDFSNEYIRQKIKLSELTLSRIVKEISNIVAKNNILI